MKMVKKLATYPEEVWDDVEAYVRKKYKISTPRHDFSFDKFLHGRSFNMGKFVEDTTDRKAMKLFGYLCRKLDIGFIPDSSGWKVITISEKADALLDFLKKNKTKLEEVKSLEI